MSRIMIPSEGKLWRSTMGLWLRRGRILQRLKGEVRVGRLLLHYHQTNMLATLADLDMLHLLEGKGQPVDVIARAVQVPREDLETLLCTATGLKVLVHDNDRYRLSGAFSFLAHKSERASVGRLRELQRLDGRVWGELPDLLRSGEQAEVLPRASSAIASASHSLDDCILPALESLPFPVAGRVLDVGCGDAGYMIHMLNRSIDSTGVGLEISQEVAHMAIQNVRNAGLDDMGRVEVGSYIGHSPLERYDLILGIQMIYYLTSEAKQRDFFEWTRCQLSDNGLLVLVYLSEETDQSTAQYPLLFRLANGLSQPPSHERVSAMLYDSGYQDVITRRLVPGGGPVLTVARA